MAMAPIVKKASGRARKMKPIKAGGAAKPIVPGQGAKPMPGKMNPGAVRGR